MTADAARLTAALADRYIVEREIGAGGMATVYLAQDIRHGRSVAMKVLHPELSAIIGAERFLAEIRTTAALQHPHILPLFDSGSADGQLFYVMPFVDGETLRARLEREKQLPVADAVRITREVATALDYAHRRGIIHRDIKPENILLSEGQALVADFGIALAVQSAGGQRMTQTGLSLGTPQYMSPEQAMGEREITARSDVYSLGTVAYEMLVGEPPFVGPTAQSIFAKIMTEEARPLVPKRKSVPPEVEAAVLKAIEKLPADRFTSAAEFAAAMERPLPAGTTVSRGAQPVVRSPLLRALPWVFGIAAAAVAFVAGRGVAARDTGAPQFTQKTFGDYPIWNARYANDQKTLVFSAGLDTSRVYVIRPEYPEPQLLDVESAHLLSVSSKGELAVVLRPRYLGQLLFQGTLARLPLEGGAPRELIEGVREAEWSPDGSELAITHLVNGNDRLEFPVGKVLVEVSGYVSDLRFSPDGKHIAFVEHPFRYDDRGVIAIVDLAGKKSVLTPTEFSAIEGLAWSQRGDEILFSAANGTHQMVVNAVDLDGKQRVALNGAGDLQIRDVGQDGELLVVRSNLMSTVMVRTATDSIEKASGWLDYSFRPIISSDGSMVAFGDASDHGGPNYSVMLRKTNGGRAVRLGEGTPAAFSRDGKWVLSYVPSQPARVVIYPTGPGNERRVATGNVNGISNAYWSPDEKSVVFCGSERSKAPACYQQSVDATTAALVVVPGGSYSPDGRLLAGTSPTTGIRIVDPAGTNQRPVPGSRPGDALVRWSPDGKEVWARRPRDSRVDRIDIVTGRRSLLTNIPTLSTRDGAGLRMADDPRFYVHQRVTRQSQIFVVKGIR